MSSDVKPRTSVTPRRIRMPVKQLVRDPAAAFSTVAEQLGDDVVRLDLGVLRPLLVTKPEHIHHVLRGNVANYSRTGMMWKPMSRLNGNGLAGEGPQWARSRAIAQPLFAAKYLETLIDHMADAIDEAVTEAAAQVQPIDACVTMTRIVQRALIRVIFGGRISVTEADRLGPAIGEAFTSLGARMLLPFMPIAVPMPGDRAFQRAVRSVDEVIYPLIQASREHAADDDIVSKLVLARDDAGEPLTDLQIRDDVVAIFVAGTETTALALTWLWVRLTRHPEVTERLQAEVDRVVGDGPVRQRHLNDLRYTKMVIQEVLRLYPGGWVLPRTAQGPDTIDGVPVSRGATVLLSPYLTHRHRELWPDPEVFDPERFAPDAIRGRHPFAFFPFGGGAHRCLGSHLSMVEAQLVTATMMSRFKPTVRDAEMHKPFAAVSLRPHKKVELVVQ